MYQYLRNLGKQNQFLRVFYRDVYNHRGAVGALKALNRHVLGRIRGQVWSFHQSREHLSITTDDVDTVLDAIYHFPGYGPYWQLTPIQDRKSLQQLASEVSSVDPRGILEIGTSQGGTLFVWANCTDADPIVSVDIPNVLDMTKSRMFMHYREDDSVHLLHSNSHIEETVAQVTAIFDGDLEFLFIDGDHSYEGVKQDFEDYAPLVEPGGMIAFDDIGKESTGVGEFWSEIRDEHDTEVLRDSEGEPDIGIVHV